MNSSTRFFILSKFILHRTYSDSVKATKIAGNPKRPSHKRVINRFFLENEHLTALKEHIPEQHLTLRRAGLPENLYLICPKVAKIIASHVKAATESNGNNQVIAETNAGLGLISMELLENGVTPVRVYETCPDFRKELKDFEHVYSGQVEVFTKDIFHLYWYSYMDRQDHRKRVDMLLKDVPKRSWSDDPVMTIVGAMPKFSFLKYLIKCLCLQSEIVTYGRIQIIAIMRPSHFAILNSTPQDNLLAYQYWTMLSNLFFEYELLEKIPRNVYLPWESPQSVTSLKRYPMNLDPDKLYLVKLNLKNLPVAVEHLLPLLYFGKHFFGRGSKRIIPTIEKWIPGCGLNILLPKLEHPDYFDDISIFTQFRELTPSQLLAVFKELVNYPSYPSSSFKTMVENNVLKSETVETDLAESPSQTNVEDLEQKLGID
ncbi:dimethyladenosine transferase 2, mitochondrial [Anoplophora glabripennis]|uniref:dimethyladenosine transferase 2, mitochondrial n=1 Tax=Anoplophora glabripennis TaxID=217634 RepID=UPI000873C2B9|nr:dimethyladenosine transferase 2, mitochondrial [Anoplophora glabripennis]